MKHIQPKLHQASFTCPNCGVLAKQEWQARGLKFESFGMEQTYKVDKLEFLNFSDLEDKIDINFLGSIESRFDDMSSELKKLYN